MKKKRIIGIISGFVILIAFGLTIASITLTAPGMSVNGVAVGLSTKESALDKINKSLNNDLVNVNEQQFTYSDLGVLYDEGEVDTLFKNSKVYNFDKWNKNSSQPIVIDDEIMQKTVSEKFPESYTDPVNAKVELNEAGDTWVAVPGKNGTMPIVEELRKTIENDLVNDNKTDAVKGYELQQEEIAPKISDKVAEEFASNLNNMAKDAGYYEGDELKVEISKSDFAELITVETTEDGFKIVPVEESLTNYAETIPEHVNKEADSGKAIVDDKGKVLKTLDEWQDGYKFEDVEGLAKRTIEQLNKGESAKFQLEGEIAKAKVEKHFHRIEVDLSGREVRTYDNDKLVKSYPVAIGKPSTPTDKGNFKVFHQTEKMNMGCTPAYDYCTKDVPWATFYNGGEAFHGTWWHSDFGNVNSSMKSHGCVNMRISDSKEIYYFAQTGTPVHVF